MSIRYLRAEWVRRGVSIMLVVALILPVGQAFAVSDSTFVCGGKIESEVWDLWDRVAKNYFYTRFLQDRLLKQGDVYALYDFQIYTHNVVSMARRCNRINRLQEVAKLIEVAYGALESSSQGRRWVCRGGAICNDKNRLLNTEVQLCSVQFLGLVSSAANALASSNAPLNDEDKLFIRNTVKIVIEHLLRWGDDAAINSFRKVAKVTPQDVKKGSSEFFFTDKPLWMITIYAELAGILQSKSVLGLDEIPAADMERLSRHLSALLEFFSARVSIQHDPNSRLGNVDLADIDRGYWRFFADNRYAGYEKEEAPVVCLPLENDKAKFKQEVRVSADSVPQRQDIGWDISHARRLVNALDAIERNRKSMAYIFSLSEKQLPSRALPQAFANTLVAVVWNGDTAKPLFANYWCGANGWYRVAYDSSGAGQCINGYPPYGISDSFLTGGYIAWAKYNPVIGLLGQNLYYLLESAKRDDAFFVDKYYAGLRKQNVYSRMMFLPSIVGTQ